MEREGRRLVGIRSLCMSSPSLTYLIISSSTLPALLGHVRICTLHFPMKPRTDILISIDWMNALQHIPMNTHGPVLVTLNPHHPFEPRPETVVGRWKYDHPVLDSKVRASHFLVRRRKIDFKTLCVDYCPLLHHDDTSLHLPAQAIRAQTLLPTIQAKRGISYAGAYLRYGFHEDGFTSGLRAVMGIPDITIRSPQSEATSTKDDEAADTKDDEGGGRGEDALRMPFDVLEAESEPEEVWVEKVFVVLEGYGVRKVCGWVGDGVLLVVWIVWVLVRGMV